MLKIVAIKLNTISNSRKSSIQTLHTDLNALKYNTFKNISAGLTRQTKNEEKDSNSSNASLFTSACLGFSSSDHSSNTPLTLSSHRTAGKGSRGTWKKIATRLEFSGCLVGLACCSDHGFCFVFEHMKG